MSVPRNIRLTRFAFIIHPITVRDAARRYPIAKYVPEGLIKWFLRRKGPVLMSELTKITAKNGATTEGWFIACPLTPEMMLNELTTDEVYARIGDCVNYAAELGADIVGLGAFTAVVGDGGVTIAKNAPIAITTGNSYTVATAIEGTLKACALLNVDLSKATLAVVGATGSIGKTCARMLGRKFGRTIVVGRDEARTRAVAEEIGIGEPTTNIEDIRQADAIITVTSSDAPVILPEHLKIGAIVCDVARPRDVSLRVGKERPDVLVIEGGVVAVPGKPDFGFKFGFPPGTAYACMSETMMLALEGRAESFTLGKDVSEEQVEETLEMAERLGFELDGFRSFERAVDNATIERVKNARKAAG